MSQDGAFLLPHTGPQTLTSYTDIMNRTLAAFKVLDNVRFFNWSQGVLGSHQRGTGSHHEFIRDRYAMSGQKARRGFHSVV